MKTYTYEPPRVVWIGPGIRARIHFLACWLAARVSTRAFRGRGMQPAIRNLARLFGAGSFAVYQVFGNRLLRVPLSDYYWVTPLMTGGVYEPEIGFILTKILRSDSAFVDCGANIGWWSVFATTRIGQREQVLAIEASPSMFRRLSETAALNDDRFVCLKAAVWDETGLPVALSYHEILHSAATLKGPSGPGFRLEETTTTRLDDAAEKYLHRPSGTIVLKLDVEGSEVEALRGAEQLVDDRTLIIYEDHGKDPDPTVTKAVLGMGLRVFFCDERLQMREMDTAERVQSVKRDPRRGYNFFACRSSTTLHRELTTWIESQSYELTG